MNTRKTAASQALKSLILTAPDDCLAEVAILAQRIDSLKPKQFTSLSLSITSDPEFLKAADEYRRHNCTATSRRLIHAITNAVLAN